MDSQSKAYRRAGARRRNTVEMFLRGLRSAESPVYKWLLLRGEEFGWYPYQNEPWHWEFNPPGFREIFWAEFPGGAPERGIIIDEP